VHYAELLCLTNFSFQLGASHPRELVERAKELGYTALAIADECSLAGIVRAHEAAETAGLPLIIGSQFQFEEGDRVALLAPTQAAYSQICELITRARRAAPKGTYSIGRADFENGAISETIALWVPGRHISAHSVEWFAGLPVATAHLAHAHHLEQDSAQRLDALLTCGQQFSLPVIAVGDVHYHVRDRRPLHDVLTATRLKTTVDKIGRKGFANGERHLRPLSTLRKLYPAELLAASVEIAQRCTFSLKNLRYEYPEELVPAGKTASEHLRDLTEKGIRRRWPQGPSPEVRQQIEKELVLIRELRFEHYFLTVEEIVSFARSNGILCQGRGSAANSAVCYVLGVTEVDPARMNLLLERFISKERHEPPDIDIDFEHQRREEVMQHIYEKYGRHRAALAATVITYRRRMAIRDVARALGLPLDLVDALAKSLQWFDGAAEVPTQLVKLGFNPKSRVAQLLMKLVAQIVGFPRHLSQHVGGFVMSQQPLSTLVPVENAAMPDRTIIQWDKNDLDSLGLLKVDCLALGMMSAIRRALDLQGKFEGRIFRMQDIPPEDPATYDMLCKAESVGVFQVESRAQMTMLPRLKPRCYFDLVIEVAIIRPGPIQGGMVHPYLRRRQGVEKVTYPNAALEKILGPTLGVPLFQEQVMEIAMVAAGFSAGEADKVRRSMAAWQRKGGLADYRDKLMSGMLERGYSAQFAEQIYNQILGFGSYGFPQSHSASFALLVYTSAWLRRHAPAAFVAGLLNSWPMGFYAPAQLVNDARRNGVVFRPVDVLKSEWDCTLEASAAGQPEVRLGLRMVSGLAEAQGQAIVEARRALGARAVGTDAAGAGAAEVGAVRAGTVEVGAADVGAADVGAVGVGAAVAAAVGARATRSEAAAIGPRQFADVDELAHLANLPQRTMEQLARAGALATLAGHRRLAHWGAIGVERLPGALAGASARERPMGFAAPSEGEDVVADYRGMGLTLRRHPLALIRGKLRRLGVHRAADLAKLNSGITVSVAGIVTHRQRPETASGVIFMSLEDETGMSNLIVWPRVQQTQREAVFGARLMVVQGELQSELGVIHVIAAKVRDYSHWLGRVQVGSRDFR
jgi:error-prone DNA polymerase